MQMKNIVFFTGAGVSAESGVKTFRDHNGLWDNHRIEEVAHIDGWRANRELVLSFYNARRAQMATVVPNAAHIAIAELANDPRFSVRVVTQNVDDLHERAGSTNIIHLHGELKKSRSTVDPRLVYECTGDINIGDKCEKGSQLRPHITWFGEMLDTTALSTARDLAMDADYFVIVGTSMVVQPAASIPFLTGHKTPIFYVDPNGISDVEIPEHRRMLFTHVMANATTGIKTVIDRINRLETDIKVGDNIRVLDSLVTKVTKIDGDKYYFLDEDGKEWQETKDAIELVR